MLQIDLAATLRPSSGIARSVQTIAPSGVDRPLWTVGVDVGIGDRRHDDSPLDITWVGAAGFRKANTFVRAAGESVERSALFLRGKLTDGSKYPWAPRGHSWSKLAEMNEAQSYQSVTIQGARTVNTRVPAFAVDYPPLLSGLDVVDAGPSGTASGLGRKNAIESAAKETIERDAAMMAWYNPQRAYKVTQDKLLPFPTEVRKNIKMLEKAEVVFSFYCLKAVADVQVMLCLAVDYRNGVVGAGLGLEVMSSDSALRALQEALQIRTLLIDLKRLSAPSIVALPIETEIDRARFWSGDKSVVSALKWMKKTEELDKWVPRANPIGSWSSLLEEYSYVDLTPRLPEAIRAIGWSVVRIFCPSLQPLRMSEAFSWNHSEAVSKYEPHPFV